MKRFRIDFTVRELDVPPEEARGVAFGDEVAVGDVFGFFNRCRDAVVTLFSGKRPADMHDPEDGKQKMMAEDAARRVQRNFELMKERQAVHRGPGSFFDRRYVGLTPDHDDGSRGGDGPSRNEWDQISRPSPRYK